MSNYSYYVTKKSFRLVKKTTLNPLVCGLDFNKIIISWIPDYDDYDNLQLFDVGILTGYQLTKSHKLEYSQEFDCDIKKIEYSKNSKQHDEYQYLDLMKYIIDHGNQRMDRTLIGTKSIFAPNPLRFDITESIPLVTTKYVNVKSIIKELLFFIRGQTDTKILEKQNVNIWKGNTSREFLDSRNLDYQEGDMGPMYGWVLRHIGAKYSGCCKDYSNQGRDQLLELIDGLKKDPYSRRHLLSTYCPLYNDLGCLIPCHGIVIQFYVEDGFLSCHVYCRSQDTFLGQNYNFTSYSLLTYIIAKLVNLHPKELILSMGDAHVYNNHFEQVSLQIKRTPLPFPVLVLDDFCSIDELTEEHFHVEGYIHHPAIKAPMAI